MEAGYEGNLFPGEGGHRRSREGRQIRQVSKRRELVHSIKFSFGLVVKGCRHNESGSDYTEDRNVSYSQLVDSESDGEGKTQSPVGMSVSGGQHLQPKGAGRTGTRRAGIRTTNGRGSQSGTPTRQLISAGMAVLIKFQALATFFRGKQEGCGRLD